MKKILLNMKSSMEYNDIKTYVTNLKLYKNSFIIFPSSLYSNEFVKAGFITGIQNIAENSESNQTGEITAKQAVSSSIKYVIIGHSERRQNQKENYKVLINKFNEAIKYNLDIVYCVGETLVDYKMQETNNIILKELDDIFDNVDKNKINNLYIAYEPIWAIGSGMTPTAFEIEKVCKYINDYLDNKNIKANILYGGSVNEENIKELSNINFVDGFLIGGASNDYKKVIKICEFINNSTK